MCGLHALVLFERASISMSESAVRYFVPDSRALPRTLRGKLTARRDELGQFVVDGHASDFADYRFRVGQIEGLTQAIDICEQIEKDEER